MTTKLPVPAFAAAVRDLTDYALVYPDFTSPHAYITISAHNGAILPHDLIAHAFRDQGGNLSIFTGLRDITTGTANNTLRLPLIWDRMYEQPALFLGLKDDEQKARNLMTYWLYNRVQVAQDRKDATWKSAMLRALRYTRRLILHPNSGFLVQTHGNHAHLVEPAIAVLDEAIAKLK